MKRKIQKWFNPEITNTGWSKDDLPETRRAMMVKAHGGNVFESAKALQALANVTRDKQTREAANFDADYLYRQHNRLRNTMMMEKHSPIETQRYPRRQMPACRVTPRTPRITEPVRKLR